MKVLLYSRAFSPSLGGLETVSRTLAANLRALGHECVVVTDTPSDAADAFDFRVVRRPGARGLLGWIRWADVVHSNGASLRPALAALLLRKPFLWTHQGYQLVSLDGLGWLDGAPAPLRPWASVRHHARKGRIVRAIVGAPKLLLRRCVARVVSLNVAISEWVRFRQPLPRQVVIYNPFPLASFTGGTRPPARFDFVYVGRLVSEKGVPVLLRAFRTLLQQSQVSRSLAIVGDGPQREAYLGLAKELGLMGCATFLGARTGEELRQAMLSSRVGIVPSSYEEPLGGVALEMMRAGIPVIVSRAGGLAECVGQAGLTFANGDETELCAAMARLAGDERLRAELSARAVARAEAFDEMRLTRQYVDAYRSILAGAVRSSEPG